MKKPQSPTTRYESNHRGRIMIEAQLSLLIWQRIHRYDSLVSVLTAGNNLLMRVTRTWRGSRSRTRISCMSLKALNLIKIDSRQRRKATCAQGNSRWPTYSLTLFIHHMLTIAAISMKASFNHLQSIKAWVAWKRDVDREICTPIRTDKCKTESTLLLQPRSSAQTLKYISKTHRCRTKTMRSLFQSCTQWKLLNRYNKVLKRRKSK